MAEVEEVEIMTKAEVMTGVEVMTTGLEVNTKCMMNDVRKKRRATWFQCAEVESFGL